jgi:hypothetical protein
MKRSLRCKAYEKENPAEGGDDWAGFRTSVQGGWREL